jgi:hypothetical protein
MVFRNQIADLPPMPDRKHPKPTIFYGAQNREADWAPIMDALNNVLCNHREAWVHVVHDRAFFDALAMPSKTFHPFLPYDQYRSILRSCDIALLPLEPTRFSECKSDLKFLECAAEGVAVIGSSTTWKQVPSFKSDRSRNMGCLYTSPYGFETGLENLIQSQKLRQVCTEDAYSYVRNHRMLNQHFSKRLAWYRELLSSKQELDRQLFERVPELARHVLEGSPA